MDAKRLVLAGRTALTPASGVYHPPRQHLFTSSCRGCVQRAGALAAPQPQHIGITLTQKRDSLHRNRDHPDHQGVTVYHVYHGDDVDMGRVHGCFTVRSADDFDDFDEFDMALLHKSTPISC